MHLNDIIIIYLAAAAPFGVASYVREQSADAPARTLRGAAMAALVWPLTLLTHLRFQQRSGRGQSSPASLSPPPVPAPLTNRRDEARHALLTALYSTEDSAQSAFGLCAGDAAVRAVCESAAAIECYAELTRAVAESTDLPGSNDDAASFPRTLELCRIAGREGDDLIIAGRCLQRRNAARLGTHHAESRLQLLQALGGMGEVFIREQRSGRAEAQAVHNLFAALLETYACAIEFFSLLGDERAVASVARLHEAARAHLSRSGPAIRLDAPDTLAPQNLNAAGDEPCTTSIPPSNQRPQLTSPQTIKAHG